MRKMLDPDLNDTETGSFKRLNNSLPNDTAVHA